MDYLDQYDDRYRAEQGLQSRAEYEEERRRELLLEIEQLAALSDAGADSDDVAVPPRIEEDAAAMKPQRLEKELAQEMAGRTDLLPPWRRYLRDSPIFAGLADGRWLSVSYPAVQNPMKIVQILHGIP